MSRKTFGSSEAERRNALALASGYALQPTISGDHQDLPCLGTLGCIERGVWQLQMHSKDMAQNSNARTLTIEGVVVGIPQVPVTLERPPPNDVDKVVSPSNPLGVLHKHYLIGMSALCMGRHLTAVDIRHRT